MSLLRAGSSLLLDWAPIVIALATSVVGLLTEGAAWLLVGAVAAAVPSSAASHDPGRGWILSIPAVLVLAAWLVRRQKRGSAAILVGVCATAGLVLALL